MKFYEGIEKREFLRVDYEKKINFNICSPKAISSLAHAMTKNISSCGILFSSKKKLNVGDFVAIELDFHTLTDVVEIDDTVISIDDKLLGKIVRVEELVPNKEYDIGVCFVKDSDADRDDVKSVIDVLKGEAD